MHGGVNWGGGTDWKWENALDLCQGAKNSESTVKCFNTKISEKIKWKSAIDLCKSDKLNVVVATTDTSPLNNSSVNNTTGSVKVPDNKIDTGNNRRFNTNVSSEIFEAIRNERVLAEENIAKIEKQKALEIERRKQAAYRAKRNNPSQSIINRLDCDDNDPSVHPFQNEICNNKDDNCNGKSDYEDGVTIVVYQDLDGDGFGNSDQRLNACPVGEGLSGVALRGGDCNDNDFNDNPITGELCQ